MPAHVAALNLTGAGLKHLISVELPIETISAAATKYTTAHFAAVCSSDANLNILIEKDVSLASPDAQGCTPLMWALRAQKPIALVKTLLENISQGEKNAKDNKKMQAVHYLGKYGIAATELAPEWIALTLDHKLKLTQADGWLKMSPLLLAARNGHFSLVKALIEGVPRLNLDKGDKFNRTPLLLACRNGHADVAALLLKHHAEASIPDTSGNTPLHHAAAYGWRECVKVLLEYGGIDPSSENSWKATPIIIAL